MFADIDQKNQVLNDCVSASEKLEFSISVGGRDMDQSDSPYLFGFLLCSFDFIWTLLKFTLFK
jgi:hypothetical protein